MCGFDDGAGCFPALVRRAASVRSRAQLGKGPGSRAKNGNPGLAWFRLRSVLADRRFGQPARFRYALRLAVNEGEQRRKVCLVRIPQIVEVCARASPV